MVYAGNWQEAHTYTHPFNGPLSGTTRVGRYQNGKINLDFTEATDSEWHWHQLGHMQVCTSLQTDNHASTSPLSFLQAGCPTCRPTDNVKALKADWLEAVAAIWVGQCPSGPRVSGAPKAARELFFYWNIQCAAKFKVKRKRTILFRTFTARANQQGSFN